MTLRTVVLSHEAQEVIDRESQLHTRLQDVYSGLEWRLSHDPRSGYQKDSSHWIIRLDGNEIAKIPTIVVLYRFDENEVEVMRLLIKVTARANASASR